MQPVVAGESFWKRLLKLFGIGAKAEAPAALPAPSNKQQGRRDGGRNDRGNRNNRGGNDQRRDGNRGNETGGHHADIDGCISAAS